MFSFSIRRANSRLAEANSKLLNERSRSLITSSIANGSIGGPSLDVGTLATAANYGATLGPLNRSFGLGLSLLSPTTDGQNSRVEDYLAKVCTVITRDTHPPAQLRLIFFIEKSLFILGHFHFHGIMVVSVVIV